MVVTRLYSRIKPNRSRILFEVIYIPSGMYRHDGIIPITKGDYMNKKG